MQGDIGGGFEVGFMEEGRHWVAGLSVPPFSTVSTADWHTDQFPLHSKPTAPKTGFTVLPHASYSRDWNKAAYILGCKKPIRQTKQAKKNAHNTKGGHSLTPPPWGIYLCPSSFTIGSPLFVHIVYQREGLDSTGWILLGRNMRWEMGCFPTPWEEETSPLLPPTIGMGTK